MDFFKKRSTAWAVLRLSIVIAFFIGRRKMPHNTVEVLPGGVYIQDNAGVLSKEQENYINRMNNGLVSQLGAEIQVATIDSSAGRDLNDMAIQLGVDTNLSGNSCVMIVAVDDGKAAIVAGESIMYWYSFDDRKLSDILFKSFSGSELDKGSDVVLPYSTVVDDAKLLSDDTVDYINSLNARLDREFDREIYVMTAKSVNGDIYKVASDKALDLGLSGSSCILLVSVEDVDAVLIPGEELMYLRPFTDSRLTDVLQSNFSLENFNSGNLERCIKDTFDDMISVYEDQFALTVRRRTPEARGLTVGEGIVAAFDRLISRYEYEYNTYISERSDIAKTAATSYSATATRITLYIIAILVVILILLIIVSPKNRQRRAARRAARRSYAPPVIINPPPRVGNYPPRGSYQTPPPAYGPAPKNNTPPKNNGGFGRAGSAGLFGGTSSRSGGFRSTSSSSSRSGSSSSRSGGFSSNSRGGSFGGSSRSGGFGGSSRGGGFGGGSRGGGFSRK